MRFALPLLAVFVLAGCSRTPETPERDSMYGAWEGEGRQWNSGDRAMEPDGRWPMRVEVLRTRSGEPAALIDYPSFPCSGRLEYLGESTEADARPGDAVFREIITSGEEVCYSGGTVLLRFDRGLLLYAWATDEAPTVASGRLAPAE